MPSSNALSSVWLIAFLYLSVSPSALCQDDASIPSTSQASNFTGDESLSSVVSFSASMAIDAARSTTTLAIPTPVNITAPDVDILTSLISAWPPAQTASVEIPDSHIASIIDQITANSSDTSTNTKRDGQIKMMIVGDSMTQGAEGDWTWRYRFWQWLKANQLNVDLVGPYSGTIPGLPTASPPQPPPLYGSASNAGPAPATGRYAADVDPAFDSDHFGAWGRPVALDMSLIQGFVQQYQPDYLIVMLGFNDLGWFYSDENGLIQNMGTFITNARKANPNLKFAIANVPQRLWLGRQDLVDKTNRYNAMLPGQLTAWSTPSSPLVHVELRHNYTCTPSVCSAGYDGLHPDALGDYQIASAFSTALHNFYGLGQSGLAIPANIPLRPVQTPSNFQVVSSPYGVTATWDPVFGAYSYDIQISINGGAWQSSAVRMARFDTTWPFDGATYAIRVRTNCGMFDYLQSAWTASQSVVARPQLAAPPRNLQSYATETGLTVTWDPPTGPNIDSIVEYNVIWWDLDAPCAFITGAAFKSSPAHIDGLPPGHKILIAPTTWNKGGMGFPAAAPYVRVGNTGTPAQISNLNAVTANANNIHMTWQGPSDVAGYSVWIRNTLNSSDVLTKSFDTGVACWDLYAYYPAVWYFEYCVSAYNGIRDSGHSAAQCVKPPIATSTISPVPTCPALPGWCPQFFNPVPPSPGNGDAPPVTQTLTYTSTATSAATTGPTPVPIPRGGWADGETAILYGYPLCDVSVSYPDLDSLLASPAYTNGLTSCLALLALDTLINMEQTALTNYTSVDNGYDKEFGYYATYMHKLIPMIIIQELMYPFNDDGSTKQTPDNGPGIQYFTCSESADGSSPFACSLTVQQHSEKQVWYTLNDRKGFETAAAKLGLLPDWISYGSYTFTWQEVTSLGKPMNHHIYAQGGFPIMNTSLVLANPKDIVTAALNHMPTLIQDMEATRLDILFGIWTEGVTMDPVQAYSTAVMTLMQAIDNMAQVKALGAQEEQSEQDAERNRIKSLITLILGAVFVFIPFVGEAVAGVAGLAELGAVIAGLGELGNAALAAYSIANDPSSAFFDVIGLVLGIGGIAKIARTAKGMGSIAKLTTAMTAGDVAAIGKIFAKEKSLVDQAAKFCKF